MGAGLKSRCPLPFLMQLPDHIAYTYQPLASVDLDLSAHWLSAQEQQYLQQVTHKSRQREYRAGRVVARQFAGQVLSCPPEKVPLVVAEDGSLGLEGTPFSISLAHAKQGICVAVAEGISVGIDLEAIKPRHADLYRFIFHPDEYELLNTLDLDRDSILILSWALKEATLKGMKTGFRCSPKKLKLTIDLEGNEAGVEVADGTTWQCRFEKRDGCYLAIAYPK